MPAYVLRCLRAHAAAGPSALRSFLDDSFLGDGATSLCAHLRAEIGAKISAEISAEIATEIAASIAAGNVVAEIAAETATLIPGVWAWADAEERREVLGYCDCAES